MGRTETRFKRYLFDQVRWNNRLIGIKGARGTGKATLVLQWLKLQKLKPHEAAYFSLDDLFFTHHTLRDVANTFYQAGGKLMVLDEVHKYPNWSMEIKNIHDFLPELKVVFTGSSIIDSLRQQGDLSRRALIYELEGMSYREFLAFTHHVDVPLVSLNDLVDHPGDVNQSLPKGWRPMQLILWLSAAVLCDICNSKLLLCKGL